jgi:urea transport system permease protein
MTAIGEKRGVINSRSAPPGSRKGTFRFSSTPWSASAIFLLPSFIDDDFLLNRIARYLVLGMLAMALSLSWGYAGILNLGLALSFGLGSYCMAMALKLRTVPVHTGLRACRISWSGTTSRCCPGSGSRSIRCPLPSGRRHRGADAAVRAALGWFMFRGRVTGVYVAIITLPRWSWATS